MRGSPRGLQARGSFWCSTPILRPVPVVAGGAERGRVESPVAVSLADVLKRYALPDLFERLLVKRTDDISALQVLIARDHAAVGKNQTA